MHHRLRLQFLGYNRPELVLKALLRALQDLDEAYLTQARARFDNFDTSPEFDDGANYINTVEKNRSGEYLSLAHNMSLVGALIGMRVRA